MANERPRPVNDPIGTPSETRTPQTARRIDGLGIVGIVALVLGALVVLAMLWPRATRTPPMIPKTTTTNPAGTTAPVTSPPGSTTTTPAPSPPVAPATPAPTPPKQ